LRARTPKAPSERARMFSTRFTEPVQAIPRSEMVLGGRICGSSRPAHGPLNERTMPMSKTTVDGQNRCHSPENEVNTTDRSRGKIQLAGDQEFAAVDAVPPHAETRNRRMPGVEMGENLQAQASGRCDFINFAIRPQPTASPAISPPYYTSRPPPPYPAGPQPDQIDRPPPPYP